MSGNDTVVPFLDAAAKRANDEVIARIKGVPANQDGGDPNIAAVENMLKAIEGLQVQVTALIDLVVDLDARIKRLEGKSRIIKVQS